MNRTVVSGIAAFALMIGASIITSDNANAGLFSGKHCGGGMLQKGCGGGLLSRLHAGSGDCCAPEPVCCEPAPVCCEPEPTCCPPKRLGLFARLRAKCAAKHASPCCEPEPVCCEPEPVCCEPVPVCCEPEPVCAPEPVCCEAPVAAVPCCGEVVTGGSVMETSVQGGYDLAPGETVVPGSVQDAPVAAEAAAPAAEEAAPAAVESSSDAPPAPQADANTDI